MQNFLESSFQQLFKSTVAAFPRTTKRQHSTQPVEIETIRWTPYVGLKTLLVRGEARNEDRHYNTIVLFRNVGYDGKGVRLHVEGIDYQFSPINLDLNDISIRCNCPDFNWRFNYFDSLDKSLYGRVRSPYIPKTDKGPANPLEMPGMCKHLIKTVEVLKDAGLFL